MGKSVAAATAAAFLTIVSLSGCGSTPGGNAVANASCTPAHGNLKTTQNGTLSVSVLTLPPFTEMAGNQLKGLEGEILDEVAKMECLTVTAQPLDTGSVVAAAQNGRVDLAAGNWYCTAKRAEVLELLGPVYGDQLGIVSSDGADTFESLKGRQVGAPDGYNWVDEFKQLYGANVKIYPNPTAMYNDLRAGRIDAATDSFGSASYVNKQDGGKWKVVVPKPDSRVAVSDKPGQVCFPMSKTNPELSKALGEDIEKLRQNGKLGELLKKHGLDESAANPGPLNLP